VQSGARGKASRLALVLCCLVAGAPAQAAKQTVMIELVLALDASASIDRSEFRLELEGLALAFRDPDVVRQIEAYKPLGVAVAVIQWGGPGETRVVMPFTTLVDGRDSKALGFRIGLIQRWMWASSTSIADGIDDGRKLIEGNDSEGIRKIIDVSGDGEDNAGGDLAGARARAKTAGITINGLPIMADDSSLADYYENNVIEGAGAFIEPARDFDDYARAIKEKLLRELRPPTS
jgi:hypothetical protein